MKLRTCHQPGERGGTSMESMGSARYTMPHRASAPPEMKIHRTTRERRSSATPYSSRYPGIAPRARPLLRRIGLVVGRRCIRRDVEGGLEEERAAALHHHVHPLLIGQLADDLRHAPPGRRQDLIADAVNLVLQVLAHALQSALLALPFHGEVLL